MKVECTEERFLRDVKNHKITLIKNDGLYRHLRLQDGDSCTYYYDIITWPGYLCVCGDMGTYTFRRTEDMFCFFRMRENDFNYSEDKTLNINPGYWEEKLEDEGSGMATEWSRDFFEEQIKDKFEDYCNDNDLSDEARDCLWSEIEDEILLHAETEESGYEHVCSFESAEEDIDFSDFYERSSRVYTLRFIWVLYAIVWGIKQYDKLME